MKGATNTEWETASVRSRGQRASVVDVGRCGELARCGLPGTRFSACVCRIASFDILAKAFSVLRYD